jgi:hypothetical protein
LLIALTCCEGCKKDDPKPLTELEKLPAASQSGRNTFGCLINGKALIPSTSIDAGAVYQQGILQMGGKSETPSKSLSIVVYEKNYGLLDTTSYPLNKYPDSAASARIQINNNLYCSYDYTNTYSGNLKITNLDRENYIISGTFEFSTVTTGCDTLKITNGRFDLKYIP